MGRPAKRDGIAIPCARAMLPASNDLRQGKRGVSANTKTSDAGEYSTGDGPTFQNAATVQRILAHSRTIAVIGLSHDEEKDSHRVASYLRAQGYRVIPVNPRPGLILGETVYSSLRDIPFPVDCVDIFRPSHEVGAVVDEVIQRHQAGVDSPAVWLQLGIIHQVAAQRAQKAGLEVVMDKCTLIEHRILVDAGVLGPVR